MGRKTRQKARKIARKKIGRKEERNQQEREQRDPVTEAERVNWSAQALVNSLISSSFATNFQKISDGNHENKELS